jgi:hypothetical protein
VSDKLYCKSCGRAMDGVTAHKIGSYLDNDGRWADPILYCKKCAKEHKREIKNDLPAQYQ